MNTDSTDLVNLERYGSRVTLTLNRAERHNSLVPELLASLQHKIDQLRPDDTVKTVLLTANGRSFSTGGDLQKLHHHWSDGGVYASELVAALNQAILSLMEMPQMVIGGINGLVTGGSLGLVLGCDLVLVTPNASFAPYYTEVGFSPDGGWAAILPDLIGLRRSHQVQALNQTISAEQAVNWGLATELVPAEQLEQSLVSVCNRLEALHPDALLSTKRSLLNADRIEQYRAGLEAERTAFLTRYKSPSAQAGMARFLGLDTTNPATL